MNIVKFESVTMTSLELVDFINDLRDTDSAELRHDSFMVKVPKVLGEEGLHKFLDTYTHPQNSQNYSIYKFPKREACLMAMSYSYDIQAKVFDRMTALEAAITPALPQTYSEALRALADATEAKENAIATKAEIGNRREATAMNTASQATKKIHKLEVELDKSMNYCTVKRMELLHHGQKFEWRKVRSACIELHIEAIDIFDSNYGTVKAYPIAAWIEAYGVQV